MSNIYAGLGRIISIVNKNAEDLGTESNLLELVVSVYTGEKKKNPDDYPPEIIFKLSIWGKYGDILSDKVEVGNRVAFSGKLATPEAYESKSGDLKVSMKMQSMGLDVKLIDRVDDGDSKPAYNTKTSNGNGRNSNGSAKATQKSSNARQSAKSNFNSSSKSKPAVDFSDDDIDDSTDFFDS